MSHLDGQTCLYYASWNSNREEWSFKVKSRQQCKSVFVKKHISLTDVYSPISDLRSRSCFPCECPCKLLYLGKSSYLVWFCVHFSVMSVLTPGSSNFCELIHWLRLPATLLFSSCSKYVKKSTVTQNFRRHVTLLALQLYNQINLVLLNIWVNVKPR